MRKIEVHIRNFRPLSGRGGGGAREGMIVYIKWKFPGISSETRDRRHHSLLIYFAICCSRSEKINFYYFTGKLSRRAGEQESISRSGKKFDAKLILIFLSISFPSSGKIKLITRYLFSRSLPAAKRNGGFPRFFFSPADITLLYFSAGKQN